LVPPTLGIRREYALDFIAHASEYDELLFIATNGVCRIVKTPMVAVSLARKQRTSLIRISAHRDNGFDVLIQEVVHVFGVMRGNIDADFLHHLDSEGMNIAGGFRTGAMDFQNVTGNGAQNSLGEMTSAGIAGAEDEHGRFGHDRMRLVELVRMGEGALGWTI
jgi:hypothetical protein